MSHHPDLQKLELDAIVTLIEIDLNPVGEGWIRLTNQSNDGDPVLHDTIAYTSCPISLSGFSYDTKGQISRPTLTFSLIDTILNDIAFGYANSTDGTNILREKLLGMKVYYKKILSRHLDNGSNPNPLAIFDSGVYYINSFSIANKVIEITLTAPHDQNGKTIPAEKTSRDTCRFEYRGSRCKYQGTQYYDINDIGTLDPSKDQCSKSLKGCQLRQNQSNFGGFPMQGRK